MQTSTFLILLYIPTSYVAAIHLWAHPIGRYKTRRDDPRVIKSRIRRVMLVTALNLLLIPWFLAAFGNHSFISAFLSIGLIPGVYLSLDGTVVHYDIPRFIESILSCLKLACILYSGPLLDNVSYYLLVPDASVFEMWSDVRDEIFTIWGFRNYIFGPVTEEIFFTAMLTNCHILTSPDLPTQTSVLWILPLFFGLAHVHHAWELHSTGLYGPGQVILSTLLQLTYTTIFGAFTNFIFLRSGGNLWCCILLHCFANYMGLPQGSELASCLVASGGSTPLRKLYAHIWKYAYVASLVVGIVAFKNNIHASTSGKYSIELQ
ncbi:LADA_0H05468g1_1 [Lachancea dasiensis]|uniref:intramembrane prenyl-peptidase Rce1 n=1 Tax=Lachancea dasiensis TaxID=1072105 RepID=A0A1G4K182_9SACH|nr:LADA_0H05468g1_1 [Lachancea dasiensis]